ncbi:MAG: glycosyltransferase family 4 protein [Chitinophagales bacterium]|nr:glycosyltransferase family 4 protein [Chitinophagales bacterium]
MILLNSEDSFMEHYLNMNAISYLRVSYKNKYDLPKAILQIWWYLIRNRIGVVHAHLFDAGLAGLLAAKAANIKRRIYTRHHSTFHHEYFPGMVKYDLLINSLATEIIVASSKVKEILIKKEGVSVKKIHIINHGFRLQEFSMVSHERIKVLKEKWVINGSPVIGVIARWAEWKGIQYIIPAFTLLLNDYPNAQLVLANAHGEFEPALTKLLKMLPAKNYRIIQFEEDFMALYRLFDVFVHVPINDHAEAFGQVYVEALASGIPSIFTLSGIANEFVIHEKNALVVPFESSDAIYECLLRLLSEHDLTSRLVNGGRDAVNQKFRLQTMIEKFEALYTYHS